MNKPNERVKFPYPPVCPWPPILTNGQTPWGTENFNCLNCLEAIFKGTQGLI